MIKFLRYVYYKVYLWQTKVGNADIAHFSALLLMAMAVFFQLFAVGVFFEWFLKPEGSLSTISNQDLTLIGVGIIVALYFLLRRKNKHFGILREYRRLDPQPGNIPAFVFMFSGVVLTVLVICVAVYFDSMGK